MFFIYNILTHISYGILKIVALFNKKIALFIKGRQQSFALINKHLCTTDKVIWLHVASLGEYEQGLPLMQQLKTQYPQYKLLLTFFSPSGYQVKKDNTIADLTIYLPMDTKKNVKKFMSLVDIEMAFFVKYEYWPNYLRALKAKNTPTYLVSGILRENQIFFKWYAGFYRKSLDAFWYFFVQNNLSKTLLAKLGHYNVQVVGDTRFDRVIDILEKDNNLDFLQTFTKKKTTTTLVIGSSWPVDSQMLVDYINQIQDPDIKFVFAPHNIKENQITELIQKLKKPYILHTKRQGQDIQNAQVYIIDAYSLLTKAYSYATLAYVGGGFGSGIHNILEAAIYNIPVIIGPKYQKFQEAKDLVALGGCLVVNNKQELFQELDQLLFNKQACSRLGKVNYDFIYKNKDATNKIIEHLVKNDKR
ncbi:3-deoxy-D-manno-octulosonic acid transferase [Myroides sp. LJL119]